MVMPERKKNAWLPGSLPDGSFAWVCCPSRLTLVNVKGTERSQFAPGVDCSGAELARFGPLFCPTAIPPGKQQCGGDGNDSTSLHAFFLRDRNQLDAKFAEGRGATFPAGLCIPTVILFMELRGLLIDMS